MNRLKIAKGEGAPATRPREPEQMLRIAAIYPRIGIGKRTFERLCSAGTFPPPDFRIGRSPLWKSSTVAAWIEDQCQQQGERRAS